MYQTFQLLGPREADENDFFIKKKIKIVQFQSELDYIIEITSETQTRDGPETFFFGFSLKKIFWVAMKSIIKI